MKLLVIKQTLQSIVDLIMVGWPYQLWLIMYWHKGKVKLKRNMQIFYLMIKFHISSVKWSWRQVWQVPFSLSVSQGVLFENMGLKARWHFCVKLSQSQGWQGVQIRGRVLLPMSPGVPTREWGDQGRSMRWSILQQVGLFPNPTSYDAILHKYSFPQRKVRVWTNNWNFSNFSIKLKKFLTQPLVVWAPGGHEGRTQLKFDRP